MSSESGINAEVPIFDASSGRVLLGESPPHQRPFGQAESTYAARPTDREPNATMRVEASKSRPFVRPRRFGGHKVAACILWQISEVWRWLYEDRSSHARQSGVCAQRQPRSMTADIATPSV